MTWQRPSRCDSASCVEVEITPGAVGIRTSDIPETMVVATHEEWRAHLDAVRAGEHDLPGDQPTDPWPTELREQQHDILPLPAQEMSIQEIRHRAAEMWLHDGLMGWTIHDWVRWIRDGHTPAEACAPDRAAAGSPPPTQEPVQPARTGQETGLSATLPAEPGPQAPTATTHPWRLDLDAITNQATAAHDWLKRAHAPQNGDWLPLSLRDHFDHAVPALIAEVRELRAADDSDKALVAAVDQHQDTQYVALCEGTQA